MFTAREVNNYFNTWDQPLDLNPFQKCSSVQVEIIKALNKITKDDLIVSINQINQLNQVFLDDPSASELTNAKKSNYLISLGLSENIYLFVQSYEKLIDDPAAYKAFNELLAKNLGELNLSKLFALNEFIFSSKYTYIRDNGYIEYIARTVEEIKECNKTKQLNYNEAMTRQQEVNLYVREEIDFYLSQSSLSFKLKYSLNKKNNFKNNKVYITEWSDKFKSFKYEFLIGSQKVEGYASFNNFDPEDVNELNFMNNSNTNIFDLEMKEIERVWEPNEKKLSIVSKYVPSLLTTVLQEHDKNFPNKNSVSNTSLDPNYVDMQKKFKNEHSTVESLEYQFRRKFVEEKIRFIPLLFQLDDHEKAEIKNMKAQYLAAINSEFQKGYHRSSMPDLVKDSKLISCHLTFGFFGLKKTHTYKEAKKVLSANGMAVKK